MTTKHAFGDRADNPRTGGRTEHHNKPEHRSAPGVHLKGPPVDPTPQEGTPPERRSGANFDPAARR